MQLLKESEKFEIYESYTKEALRQTSQQLQDMVEYKKFDALVFDASDTNGTVNNLHVV